MSLQGTLDMFALSDLVRLLATTAKTGELAVDGDRGPGRLLFVDGDLVGGEPSPSGDAAEAVFELLRYASGTFTFVNGPAPAEPVDAVDALEALAAAEARLAAFRRVEEIVPSPAARLALRAELAEPEVTVDRATWGRLVAVGGGSTVAAFGAALDLDPVDAAVAAADLVDRGLATVVAAGSGTEVTPLSSEGDGSGARDRAASDLDFPEPESEPDPGAGPGSGIGIGITFGVEPEPEPGPEFGVGITSGVEPEPGTGVAFGLTSGSGLDPLPALAPFADPGFTAGPEPGFVAGPEPGFVAGPEFDDAALAGAPSWFSTGAEDLLPPVDVTVEDPAPEGFGGETASASSPEPFRLHLLTPDPARGSTAVDLDARLGAAADDHAYLGGHRATGALPEPLLAALFPESGHRPEPPVEVTGPDAPPSGSTATEPAPGPEGEVDRDDPPASPPGEGPEALPVAPAADRPVEDAGERAPWPVPDEVEAPLQFGSLSPAAARAVAAAASDGVASSDNDAGRRVLRRIISSGRG